MSIKGWLIGGMVGVALTAIGIVALGTRSFVVAFLLGLVLGAVSSLVGANYRRIFRR